MRIAKLLLLLTPCIYFGVALGIKPAVSVAQPQNKKQEPIARALQEAHDLKFRETLASEQKKKAIAGVVKKAKTNALWVLVLYDKQITSDDLAALMNKLTDAQKKKLAKINLDHNRIEKLPAKFGEKLSGLTKLSLCNSQISTFSEEDSKGLSNLTYLEIDYNKLEAFTAQVAKNLPNLTYLSLQQNQIKTLNPAIFDNMPKLETVALTANPLANAKEVRSALKKKGLVDVNDNLFFTLEAEKKPKKPVIELPKRGSKLKKR